MAGDEATHKLDIEFKEGTAPAFVGPKRQAIWGIPLLRLIAAVRLETLLC